MESKLKKSKNVNPHTEEHKLATPEQIHEYQVLKARNEWIKVNKKRLDEIENHKLLHVRVLLCLSIINLIVSFIILLL